jgi:hypothetical protein
MNNNTLLIILLTVIIICSLFYLININHKENNTLEKFSQRNSLSTYFQQTINSDENTIDKYAKNRYNGPEVNTESVEKYWDGNWVLNSEPSNLYFSFLQVNDQLIISISKSIYLLDSNTITNTTPSCSPDTFVGIAYLNNNGKYFILNKIVCNNFTNDFDLEKNKLYGYINGNTTTASLSFKLDNNTLEYDTDPTIITKNTENFTYGVGSEYLKLSSFNTPIPQFTNNYNANMDVCYNSTFTNSSSNVNEKGALTKCNIKGSGITDNTYGTGCAPTALVINGECPVNNQTDKDTCLIRIPDPDNNGASYTLANYDLCDTTFDIKRNFNSNLNDGLYNAFTENTGLCSSLQSLSQYDSMIIMYISDLNKVQTLNYEYFGQGPNKSNLTMQSDISTNFMEKILKTLRQNMDGSDDTKLSNALSLTNCFESNNSSLTYSQILNACKTTYPTSTVSTTIPENGKNPLIWNLSVHNTNSHACTFSLSSSNLYKKNNEWVKYADFNPLENKTNMNLYKGGNNQLLTLENINVVNTNPINSSTDGGNDSYILVSGNLKTSNPKKYLIPSIQKNGFYNNSSSINLQNNLNTKGKWVILGFNLTKESDLRSTLTAIQNKM